VGGAVVFDLRAQAPFVVRNERRSAIRLEVLPLEPQRLDAGGLGGEPRRELGERPPRRVLALPNRRNGRLDGDEVLRRRGVLVLRRVVVVVAAAFAAAALGQDDDIGQHRHLEAAEDLLADRQGIRRLLRLQQHGAVLLFGSRASLPELFPGLVLELDLLPGLGGAGVELLDLLDDGALQVGVDAGRAAEGEDALVDGRRRRGGGGRGRFAAADGLAFAAAVGGNGGDGGGRRGRSGRGGSGGATRAKGRTADEERSAVH